MKSHKLILCERHTWNYIFYCASSDFEHLSWLCLVQFSVVMSPDVNFFTVGSVRRSCETASVIELTADSHVVDMLPKGSVA